MDLAALEIMVNSDNMREWTELSTFDGIDLTESYILSWAHVNGSLVLEMDFVLTPDHPGYQPPPVNWYACFRRGLLRFDGVRSLTGLPNMADVIPAIDATGEKDYGHLDQLVEIAAGRFEGETDYGTFSVESASPTVELYIDT